MVRIKIGDDFLNIPDSEFGITMAANDIGSIESRQGAFSNDFDVPATSENVNIIGYANELNTLTTEAPYKKLNAILYRNGIAINSGYIQVNGYKKKTRQYSITYYGDNSDFFQKISDIKLVDLPLSRFNHVYDYQDVSASFGGVTEGYVYHPVNYGGTKTTAQGSDFSITNRELAPATFVHTLFDSVANLFGYTIQGGFKTNPIYKKLVLPFSKGLFKNDSEDDKYKFEAHYNADTPYASGSTYTLVFDTVDSDGSEDNYDESTGTITIRTPMKFRIVGNLKIAIDVGVQVTVQIWKNGSIEQNYLYFSQTDVGTNLETNYFEAQTGDTFQVRMFVAGSGNATLRASSFIKNEITGEVQENGQVNLAKTLPDITAGDLFQDVAIRYGLIISVNQFNKVIYINEFYRIKNNVGIALDWSTKFDASKDCDIDFKDLVSNYSKINYLRSLEDDKDDNLVAYKNENSENFGDGNFTIDNDFIEGENELYESVFAGTINVDSFTGTDNNAINMPYIQRYNVDKDDFSNESKPRILIYLGDFPVDDFSRNIGYVTITSEYGTQVFTEAPFLYFFKQQLNSDIDNFRESLAFLSPNNGNTVDSNLIERYYAEYIRILNNPKLVTASFNLNDKDILNIDWSIPIYLDQFDSYFYLNKIKDYTGNNETTEVELIKL